MRDKQAAKKFRIEQSKKLNPNSNNDKHKKPDCCEVCNGTGVYEGLLKRYECESCYGSGFDVSDPVAVIKHQANIIKSGRSYYASLQKEFHSLLQKYGVQRFKDEQQLIAIRGKDLKGRLD